MVGSLPGWTLVALGGAAGSLLRYAFGCAFSPWGARFPWGTFASNVAGCFLIGIFTAILADRPQLHPHWRLLLATGLCGGFTTLSSLLLETDRMVRSGRWAAAGGYLGSTLFLSGFALVCGLAIVRK